MKVKYLLFLGLAGITLMSGCGSDSTDKVSNDVIVSEVASIETVDAAEKAISAVGSIQAMGATSTAYTSNNSSNAPSRTISLSPINTTEACQTGSMTMKGDISETNADFLTTYNECSDGYGSILSGSMKTVGTNNNGNINMKVVMNQFRVQTEANYYQMDLSMDLQINENNYNVSSTRIDGVITLDMAEYGQGNFGYTNFLVKTDANHYLDISGSVNRDMTTDTCLNGVYNIDTTEPLKLSATNGSYEAGTMLVNGSVFEFHSDGTASVTFANGTSETVSQSAQNFCN